MFKEIVLSILLGFKVVLLKACILVNHSFCFYKSDRQELVICTSNTCSELSCRKMSNCKLFDYDAIQIIFLNI